MKVTINTEAGTIQIHGSFTYGDYKEFMETIPEAWREFRFEQPETVRDNYYPAPLPSYPQYPIGPVWVGNAPNQHIPQEFYYTTGKN